MIEQSFLIVKRKKLTKVDSFESGAVRLMIRQTDEENPNNESAITKLISMMPKPLAIQLRQSVDFIGQEPANTEFPLYPTWCIMGGDNIGRERMVVKINVSISKDILEKLDEAAREANSSRSALLSQAVRCFLEEREAKKQLERRLQAAKDIDRIREKVGPWDGTAEVLKWRDLH